MSWWMLLWESIYAQGLDRYVDLHSVNVDDVAPPTLKLSYAKHHTSLLSNFLLDNSLHFGVNKIKLLVSKS